MIRHAVLAAVLASSSVAACASSDEPTSRALGDPLPGGVSDVRLVPSFEDDFDGDAVDEARWTVRKGDMKHPKTISAAATEMAGLREGSLVLAAERAKGPNDDPRFPFVAGYVDTDGVFAQTYGRVEMRARGEFAPGLWYALWGRPWKNPVPEIDVEFLADNVTEAWLVSHWALPPLPADERRSFVTVNGIDVTAFHTYAIVWTPEAVEWQIDGAPYMRVTGKAVPREPVFWVLNVWVGGWGGEPVPQTRLPSHFEVDWFRVHRLDPWPVEPQVRIRNERERYATGDTIDIELADFDRGAKVEIREGDVLLATLERPPFRFSPRALAKAPHVLTITGTDGARRATTTLPCAID